MADEMDSENVVKRGKVNGEQGFLQGRVVQHYMYLKCMNAKVDGWMENCLFGAPTAVWKLEISLHGLGVFHSFR